MNSRLEQFIKDHRDDFDSDEPSAKVWDQLRHSLDPGESKKSGRRTTVLYMRWASAAAVLILAAAGIWFFSGPKSGVHPKAPVASRESAKPPAITNNLPEQRPADTSEAAAHQQQAPNLPAAPSGKPEDAIDQSEISEEMYHYAKIVELRQKELKKIEKDEPLLYKQFAGDVNKLDSVYRSLKKQYGANPNKEQLLEAMIQNLQLQIGLLNHQLEIIKQINHTKKSAYENAYKPA
jgi:hypothetical protein